MQINDELIRAATAKAVLEAITPENRGKLIQDAIESMLNQKGNRYDNKSEIQAAFESATRVECSRLVAERLTGDAEFQAKLKAVIEEAFQKAFSDERRQRMVDKTADTIVNSIFERY